MDIKIINEVINNLEGEETTADNIQELASLYIVREYIMPQNICSETASELLDILPHYRKYCEVKKKYQMGEITEEPVIDSIERVCHELDEFIQKLYAGTDMRKERKTIENIVENLKEKFSN